jgi:rRNA-processing protein FCF1
MQTILIILGGLVVFNTLISLVSLRQLIRNHQPQAHSTKQKPAVVDTCALIDGRLLDIVHAGFAPSTLYIPSSVIGELQHLADKADSQKRERARFGLDVVRELQSIEHANVSIISPKIDTTLPVDDQLVEIAKQYGAMLYTTDYNLNKVADIKGVQVLNVNELAQGLRTQHLPGEKDMIKLVQKGQNSSQGVGYLDDGTMVVVEKAGSLIGEIVEVTFSRVLQTQAGKMMFAKLVSREAMKPTQNSSSQRNSGKASETPALQTTTEGSMFAGSSQTTTESSIPAQKDTSQLESSQPDVPQTAQNAPRVFVRPKRSNDTHAPKPARQQRPTNNHHRRHTPEDTLLETVKRLEQ